MNITKTSAGLLALLAVSFFLLGGSVHAVEISNVTTDTTLFGDDFEGLGTAVSHAIWPDTSGDYDPIGGAPGYWAISESTGGSSVIEHVQVTDSATSPDPGAYQGSNYLRLYRPRNPVVGSAAASAYFTPQDVAGEVIHAEFVLNAASAREVAQFLLYGTGSNVRVNILVEAGIVKNYKDGFHPIDVPFVPDQWQKWEIDYEIGATTYSLSIDDVSVSDIPSYGSGDAELLMFTQGAQPVGSSVASPMYIDSAEDWTPPPPPPPLDERDSTAFEFLYTGADVKNGDDWAPYGDGPPTGTVEGDYLRMNNVEGGSYRWLFDLNHEAGWTLETSVQVTQAGAETYPAVLTVAAGDGAPGQYSFLNYGAEAVYWGIDSDIDTVLAEDDYTDGFHKVRIAQRPGKGAGDTVVWIDDQLIRDDLKGLSTYGLLLVLLGKASGGMTEGESLIEYVRLDTTGAYAPPDSGERIPGDANEDKKVTDADAAILATNWQKTGVGWNQGDFNGDGSVTDADAAILATHWQEGVTESAAAVPEPDSIVLLTGALLWLAARRFRRGRRA